MENNLNSLTNILFEQIERINDDDLTGEELDQQLKKSNAIVRIGTSIINTASTQLEALKYMDEASHNIKTMPDVLQISHES